MSAVFHGTLECQPPRKNVKGLLSVPKVPGDPKVAGGSSEISDISMK
jgi:hypothetical protein